MLLLVLIVFQVATLGPCTGHDFSPVFQAEANFHGEESSHARALALQRSKRAFYTADLQKTAEAELLPSSASLHLVITISLLLFNVGGFIFAGTLYSVFLDGEVLSPFARLLQGNLGPQGVLNNCARWIRQLVLPVVTRIGLNFAFMPNETRDDFNERGLSAFAELQFQEDFALDNMIKVVIDGTFMMLGWLVYWFIARSRNNNREQFVKKKKRSVSTRSHDHHQRSQSLLTEDSITTRYEAIIKQLEQIPSQ
eukprot:08849.XXX_304940_307541_1 [CDS] Oithona nana genome sequencing.